MSKAIQLNSSSIITQDRILFNNGGSERDTISNSLVLTSLNVQSDVIDTHFDSVFYYLDINSNDRNLYKTIDLGITKSIILDSILKNSDSRLTYFAYDKNHIWALRRLNGPPYNSFRSGFGKLHRSTDGGDTWEKVNTNLDTITSIVIPNGIYFITKDTGYLGMTRGNFSGLNDFYRTIDGGTNWHLIGTVDTDARIFYKMYFLNSLIGFAYGMEAVFKTTDGGVNWIKQTSLPQNNAFGYLQSFDNGSVIFIYNSLNNTYYYTTTIGDPAVGLFESKKSIIDITVYPNPTEDGVFTIDWAQKQIGVDVKLNIVDVLGREVPYLLLNNKTETTKANLTLQLNTSPGLYFIQMQQGAYTGSKSIVVQ
jgi:hypothetical protein